MSDVHQVTSSRPLRRYERSDSFPSLMRTMGVLVAGGLVTAFIWQALSPLGRLTLRPVGPLPLNAPLATSDVLFTVVSGVWGLIAGLGLLWSWRRHPEHTRSVKEVVWYWATWAWVGALGVVTGLVVTAALEHLGGARQAWELSTWVPLLAWPIAFNLVTCLGSLLGSGVVAAEER